MYKVKQPLKSEEVVLSYNAIDLAKFLCAILVVTIHVAPFGLAQAGGLFAKLNYVTQDYIARIAVPFFLSRLDSYCLVKLK